MKTLHKTLVVTAILLVAGGVIAGAALIGTTPDADPGAEGAADITARQASPAVATAQGGREGTDPVTLFTPPPRSAIPEGGYGDMVRLGEQIFDQPARYASAYVGNDLACSNCHLNSGREAGSAPLWAAWVAYPAFRSKNGHVNDFSERLQGCFRYSMNGTPPPRGGDVLMALESYARWLSEGAQVTSDMPGRGYPDLENPPAPADYQRGREVYEQHCALCHGEDGAGQYDRAGQRAFPALWGDQSFNWGAGMHSLKNAAPFIYANMPLGQGGSLSVQQAWDVARYVVSHERPQDPRFNGSVEETRQRYHDSPGSLYGTRVNGHLLGEGATHPGGDSQGSGS